MLIAVKLEPAFARDDDYGRLFGAADALVRLREAGVQGVELALGPETDLVEARAAIARAVALGLRVSLHPYSEAYPSNPSRFAPGEDGPCRELHARFLDLAAEVSRAQGFPTIVNIHPAAGRSTEDRSVLLGRSIGFFRWARERCASSARGAEPVAELQVAPRPGEPLHRIGDRYAELVEVVEASGVRACWDLGHAVVNEVHIGQPPDPPRELLPRVGHVHCHDVGEQDHRPLVVGSVPWRRYLGELSAAGFDGTVVLEVTARGFLESGGLAALDSSVAALRDWTLALRLSREPAPGR